MKTQCDSKLKKKKKKNESASVFYRKHFKISYIKVPCGTSLAVWWLRLRASTAWGLGLIPGQGTKILHAARHGQIKKKKKKPLTCSLCLMQFLFSSLFPFGGTNLFLFETKYFLHCPKVWTLRSLYSAIKPLKKSPATEI